MIKTLMAIRATLDKIEVRGAENMDRLLGCIQTLDDLIKQGREEEHHDERGAQ